jgi:hypothetical protein
MDAKHVGMRFSSFLLLPTVTVVLLASCSDEPNPVGAKLIPESDLVTVQIDTIQAMANSSLRKFPEFGVSTRIIVGLNNSIETEAWAWVKFTQLPDSLNTSTVVESRLELRGDVAFGGSGSLAFDVHEGLQNWHTADPIITNDSLSLESVTAGAYYAPVPFSSFSGLVSPDTLTISVALDTALVLQWLQASTDTLKQNFGIVLKPTNADHIHGFRSFRDADVSTRPRLVVFYRKPGSSAVDTAMYSTGTDRFLARLSTTRSANDSTEIFVHGGVAHRGVVNFDNFVAPRNYAIYKALLEVTLRSDVGIPARSRDSLYAYFVTQSGVAEGFVALSERATVGSEAVYRFVITDFVRFWGESAPVRSVALAAHSEGSSVDIFRLHGPASGIVDARPRLIISYTEFR